MSKTISSLNVALGASTGAFTVAMGGAQKSAFAFQSSIEGVQSSVSGLMGSAGSAVSSILELTGVLAGVRALEGVFDKVFAIPGEALTAAHAQADAQAKLGAVLAATGDAAGFSSESLNAYADELMSCTTFGKEAITNFQAVLGTFRNISGPTFMEATALALDMASVLGGDLQGKAISVGKALNDPVKGISALHRVGVDFTAQQKQQIAAMQGVGNIAGAQAVILDELKHEFGGAAAAMAATPFGKFTQLGNQTTEVLVGIGNTLADVGLTFINAFHLDNIIGSVGGSLAGVSGVIKTEATRWAPIIAGAVTTAYDWITTTFGKVYNAVAPVFGKVFSVVTTTIGLAVDFVKDHMGFVIGAIAGVAAVVTGIGTTVLAPILAPIVAIGGVIAGVVGGPLSLFGAALAAIGGFIGFDGIKSAFAAVGTAAWTVIRYVSDHWDDILTAGIEVFDGVADVASAAMGVVETVASAVWTGITAAWTAALGVLGVKTQSFGDTASSVWSTVVEGTKWLVNAVQVGLYGAAYVVSHLGDTFSMMGAVAAYEVVKLGNQVSYTFTDTIPAYLTWFADNWKNILTNAFNFTTTVFGNMAANAYEVITNLPGLITGRVKFGDIWTPLTAGFTTTLTDLPTIAARQAGPLEAALGDQADAAKKAFGQGMGNYISDHMAKGAADAAKAVKDAHDVLGGIKPPPIPPPKVTQPKPVKVKTDTSGLDDITGKAKDASSAVQELTAVLSGSATSLRAIYSAEHGLEMPGQKKRASSSGRSKGKSKKSESGVDDDDDEDGSDAAGDVDDATGPSASFVDVKSNAFSIPPSPFSAGGALGGTGRFAVGRGKRDPTKYWPDGSLRTSAAALPNIMDTADMPGAPPRVAWGDESPGSGSFGGQLAPAGGTLATGGGLAMPDTAFAAAPVAAMTPQAAPVSAQTMAAAAGGDGSSGGGLEGKMQKVIELLQQMAMTENLSLNELKKSTSTPATYVSF